MIKIHITYSEVKVSNLSAYFKVKNTKTFNFIFKNPSRGENLFFTKAVSFIQTFHIQGEVENKVMINILKMPFTQ